MSEFLVLVLGVIGVISAGVAGASLALCVCSAFTALRFTDTKSEPIKP